jgi:hypothetical protein
VSTITKLYGGRATCTFREKAHTYKFLVPNVCDKLWQPSVTGVLGMKAKPALVGWAAKESLSVVRRRLGEYQSANGENAQMFPHNVLEWIADAEENWREEDSSTTIGTVAHRFAYEDLRFRCGLTNTRPKFPIEHDPVLMPDFTAGMLEMANNSAVQVLQYFDAHDFRPLQMERPLWSPIRGFCGTPDFIGYIDNILSVADYKTSKKIYAEYWAQLSALQFMYEEEFGGCIAQRVAINIPKDGTTLQVETRKFDYRHAEDLGMFFNCLGTYHWNRANDDFAAGDPVRVLGDIFGAHPPLAWATRPDDQRPDQRRGVLTDDCPF